jgi:hypothetical protein
VGLAGPGWFYNASAPFGSCSRPRRWTARTARGVAATASRTGWRARVRPDSKVTTALRSAASSPTSTAPSVGSNGSSGRSPSSMAGRSGGWRSSATVAAATSRGRWRRGSRKSSPAGLGGVGEERQPRVGDEVEPVVGEVEVADDEMVEVLDAGVVEPDLVCGPPGAERPALRCELADELRELAVVRVAARGRAQIRPRNLRRRRPPLGRGRPVAMPLRRLSLRPAIPHRADLVWDPAAAR